MIITDDYSENLFWHLAICRTYMCAKPNMRSTVIVVLQKVVVTKGCCGANRGDLVMNQERLM